MRILYNAKCYQLRIILRIILCNPGAGSKAANLSNVVVLNVPEPPRPNGVGRSHTWSLKLSKCLKTQQKCLKMLESGQLT